MRYIDENENEISEEAVDLSSGYLIDYEEVIREEVPEVGHYVWSDDERHVDYVVDKQKIDAYTEVVTKQYIKYSDEYLNSLEEQEKHKEFLDDLERYVKQNDEDKTLTHAQIEAIVERADFIDDVIAEMAEMVYGSSDSV